MNLIKNEEKPNWYAIYHEAKIREKGLSKNVRS